MAEVQKRAPKVWDAEARTMTVSECTVSKYENGPQITITEILDYSDTPEVAVMEKASESEVIKFANFIRKHWDDFVDGDSYIRNVKRGGSRAKLTLGVRLSREISKTLGYEVAEDGPEVLAILNDHIAKLKAQVEAEVEEEAQANLEAMQKLSEDPAAG